MIPAALVLLAIALLLFLGAARALWRVKLLPDAAIAAGLACQALAVALVVMPLEPVPPEPPEPEGADFGGYRPHYQGHGVTTPGGRGGEIRRVGSADQLRAAVAARPGCVDTPQTCARIVIFDVSGNFDLGGQLVIDSPYLTLAGQTAPELGVTLINSRFLIDTHDVVVQHLRVRRPPHYLNACSIGDAGDGGDNSHVYNVVYDHVTCTWATEVNNLLVAGPGSHDVAILDSLIAEGLWPMGWGGIGAGVGYKNTVARNLFTQHWSRNPIWGAPGELALYNNLSFNGTDNSPGGQTLPAFWGDLDGEGNPPAAESTVIVNNVAVAGPDSGQVHAVLGLSKKQGSIDAGSTIYLEGNQGPGIAGATPYEQWVATVCLGSYGTYANAATCGPDSNMRSDTLPAWWSAFMFVLIPTNNVFARTLQTVGARPLTRDSADQRMIADVRNGTGTHYLDTDVVLPDIPATTRVCQLPADPHAVVDAVGRTRLEVYLESDPQCGAQRLEAP